MDIATGTGDFAIEIIKRAPSGSSIVGPDLVQLRAAVVDDDLLAVEVRMAERGAGGACTG